MSSKFLALLFLGACVCDPRRSAIAAGEDSIAQRKREFCTLMAAQWLRAGAPVGWKHEEWKHDEVEPNWAGALAALRLKRSEEEIRSANAFFAAMPLDIESYDTFDSPQLVSAWDSGVVTVRSGPERLTINAARPRFPLRIEETIEPLRMPFATRFDEREARWVPFLNYWRLDSAQWAWNSGGGTTGGCLRHAAAVGVKEAERGAHDAMLILRGGEDWTDYAFEANAFAAGGRFGLWARADLHDEGAGNGRWVQGYALMLDPGHRVCRLWRARKDNHIATTAEGSPKPERNDFSNPVMIKEAPLPPAVTYGRWLRLRMEVRNTLIRCSVEGVQIIEVCDDLFQSGSVGFVAYKGKDVRFDDVSVTPAPQTPRGYSHHKEHQMYDRRRPPVAPLVLAALAALARGDPNWPCYHGPTRDNRSTETGLLESWPAEGPRLLWTAAGLGEGYSSIAVAGGRLYTAGTIDKVTHVIALDLAGKVLWRQPNGPSWEATREQQWAIPYAGARGTPTVDGDTVYHLADMGNMRAFDAQDGEVRWHVDLLRVFEGERPKYGLSESALLAGDALLCCPGGKKGYVVALNKRTGATLWANTDIRDPVGYCSLVLGDIDGVTQVVGMSAVRVFAVDPARGTLLWQHEFGNERQNSATDVIVHDNGIYASCGYGGGSVLLRPRRQADGRYVVEQLWKAPVLDNHHGGVLRAGDFLYGAGHEARGWFCLDFKTGQPRWQVPGKGSLTYADGRLYCLDEKGTMSLVRCTQDKWEALSSFQLPRGGKGLYWAHPVVCGGRLYVRHGDRLFAYALRAK